MISPFAQPEILQQIGPARLAKFLSGFNAPLEAAHISMPTPGPDTGAYVNSVAGILASPSLLREPLRAAISALERLASPGNADILDSALARHIPCVSLPQAPLDRAFELWFFSPEI